MEKPKSIEPSFILGLIAGEGTFNVALQERQSSRWNIKPTPSFAIKMDDRDSIILRSIRDELDIGRFHQSGGMASWQVQSKKETKELKKWVKNHEDRGFNLTSKYGSFEMWCEAVEICGEAYKRLTREETIRCIELAKRMNETDSHNQISEQEWKNKVKNE